MIEKKRILIIGPPCGEIGGVRTHVDNLEIILKPYASKLKVVNEGPFFQIFFQMLKERILFNPEVIIYNLSVYRSRVIRDLVTRTMFFSRGKRHILHLHGGNFKDIEFSKYSWQILLKYHFNRFDRIFCLTNEQHVAVSSIVKNHRKVSKICNYVQLPKYEEIAKNNDTLNLLYVGRLHPLKGVMTAIRTIQKIQDENVRFWIIGVGELENEIKKITDPRIVFVGKKIGQEKNSFFSKSHVFVFPTSWPEGMPYCLLEASSYGLALISTPVGSIEDILIEGENGFIINPNDEGALAEKIQYFLNNRNTVRKFGEASRKICEDLFSIEKLHDIYHDFFLKCDSQRNH